MLELNIFVFSSHSINFVDKVSMINDSFRSVDELQKE